METSISRDEWRSYSDSQKEKIKTAFDCDQYELKLDAAPSVTITAPAASSTNADEILKYKKLLDCGAITQEEYDAKKKQLLDMSTKNRVTSPIFFYYNEYLPTSSPLRGAFHRRGSTFFIFPRFRRR